MHAFKYGFWGCLGVIVAILFAIFACPIVALVLRTL